jgi:hypothetical protein
MKGNRCRHERWMFKNRWALLGARGMVRSKPDALRLGVTILLSADAGKLHELLLEHFFHVTNLALHLPACFLDRSSIA